MSAVRKPVGLGGFLLSQARNGIAKATNTKRRASIETIMSKPVSNHHIVQGYSLFFVRLFHRLALPWFSFTATSRTWLNPFQIGSKRFGSVCFRFFGDIKGNGVGWCPCASKKTPLWSRNPLLNKRISYFFSCNSIKHS